MSSVPLLKRLVPSVKKRLAALTTYSGFALRRSQGALLLLNYQNYVDRQLMFYGAFEAAQQAKFFAAMRQHGADTMLDVGANFGLYSIHAARQQLAPTIIAFEPDTRNRMQLGANLLLNRLTDKVTVLAKAVSDHTGQVNFAQAPDSVTGQSQIRATAGGVVVEAAALDDLLKISGQKIFIKIDIEGHELAAVRGMQQLLAANQIFMQVESFADQFPALCQLLADCGLQHVGDIEHDHYFTNFASTP